MNTEHVLETIGQMQVGTLIVWAAAICTVVYAIGRTIVKAYGIFVKYKEMQDENEQQKVLIEEHDKALEMVNSSLAQIQASLNEQKDVNLKQIRHTIVHTCDDAIASGYITAGKLRSLEELYDEYLTVFNGNGYVKTLVEKTRELPVRGKLND